MREREKEKRDSTEDTSIVFDKIMNKIATWAEKGKEEGAYAIKISKIRMKISSANLQMEEKFLELGKKIYELHTKNSEINLQSGELNEFIKEIKPLEHKIVRYERLINKLRDEKHAHAASKKSTDEKDDMDVD